MLFRRLCSFAICALLITVCSPAQNTPTSPATRTAETQLIGTVMTDGQAYARLRSHISNAAVQEMLKKTNHLAEYNFNKTHGTLP